MVLIRQGFLEKQSSEVFFRQTIHYISEKITVAPYIKNNLERKKQECGGNRKCGGNLCHFLDRKYIMKVRI